MMEYEFEIKRILNQYTDKLPQSDIESIKCLADHGEWGLALENLYTQIFEYDLAISHQSYLKIKNMAKGVGLSSTLLDGLEELIKK